MNEPNGISAPAGMPRLSAHEMAALMLLEQAPVEIERGTLDMTMLRDAGACRFTCQSRLTSA
ncbi:hypothetical protein [Burkholderia ubonensis]|uniref:hypothetical protein n=1 Tax=Burkholderia ubonensis TaxID=101571 RepID=UPI0007550269|nr:hypothetical protein [Burkholderia ubonensis]KVD18021.1 hypothetical protein WI82_31010 [Burkholderia ubonensis]KWK83915.1 hypothetical protein WM17_11905 [Burkholderia ubonensis]KWK86936.1 hypothetical protein WM18_27710 [Burkholderia ubonensis]